MGGIATPRLFGTSHQGQPLPHGGPAPRSCAGWRGSRPAWSASVSRRGCRRSRTARHRRRTRSLRWPPRRRRSPGVARPSTGSTITRVRPGPGARSRSNRESRISRARRRWVPPRRPTSLRVSPAPQPAPARRACPADADPATGGRVRPRGRGRRGGRPPGRSSSPVRGGFGFGRRAARSAGARRVGLRAGWRQQGLRRARRRNSHPDQSPFRAGAARASVRAMPSIRVASPMRPPFVTTLVLMLVLGLAGSCGGGDGDVDAGDDDREIRAVVRSSLTTKNPEGDCRTWLSDNLIGSPTAPASAACACSRTTTTSRASGSSGRGGRRRRRHGRPRGPRRGQRRRQGRAGARARGWRLADRRDLDPAAALGLVEAGVRARATLGRICPPGRSSAWLGGCARCRTRTCGRSPTRRSARPAPASAASSSSSPTARARAGGRSCA